MNYYYCSMKLEENRVSVKARLAVKELPFPRAVAVGALASSACRVEGLGVAQ